MRSFTTRERFGVFAIVALAAIAFAIPADATGPTISVGALRVFSNTTAPCKSGQTCYWANGNQPNFRKSDGTDIALSSGGGGGSGSEMFLSLAQYVAHHSITSDGTDAATGNEFYTTANGTVTGVQTYWGAADTVSVEIWSGGTKLASKSSALGGAGVVTISFDTPVSVTAYTKYQVVTYKTGGGQYYTNTFVDYPQSSFQLPFINGNHILEVQSGYFSTDLAPFNGSTIIYPSFPVLTVP